MLGKVIGNYKLEVELGRGLHGVVYRALDQGRSRAVAIKALHSALAEKSAVNERLRQLAPSIAQLRHPQLAEFYTILQQGADLYLVNELIEGRTLAAILRKVGVFSAEDAVRLIVQICEPLVWLGRANWAHGDLKPANVLIASDGTAHITDLGLAYALGDQAIHTAESGLAYRAPEQLRGAGFDTRSDVYALGAMFYELVTGLLPFRRANDEALRQAHLTDPVPSPRNYFPLIPVAVESLLLRALAKQPEERFASVGEFQTALQDWLNTATKTAEVKSATNPMSAPNTNEGPSFETLRPMTATIPALPKPPKLAPPEDHFDAPPLLPDAQQHTRSAVAVAGAVETSRLPQAQSVSPNPAGAQSVTRGRASLSQAEPVANQAGFYDEVVVELDDTTPPRRKKGVLWLTIAGLAALVGIPYAMMRNVDSTATPSNLPPRSTLSLPSPTATETLEATATIVPSPLTKAANSPRPIIAPTPRPSPSRVPKIVPIVTPRPIPTATPFKRVTPLPTPMPTARQIYPPPTPTKKATPAPTPQDKKSKKKAEEQEKSKEKKKSGVGGFFKDILKRPY